MDKGGLCERLRGRANGSGEGVAAAGGDGKEASLVDRTKEKVKEKVAEAKEAVAGGDGKKKENTRLLPGFLNQTDWRGNGCGSGIDRFVDRNLSVVF